MCGRAAGRCCWSSLPARSSRIADGVSGPAYPGESRDPLRWSNFAQEKPSMKHFLTIASLLLVASASFASEETVSFKSGTDNVSAFLAKPDGPGPFPAVIVLHEWWGLDAWMKDQARALAKEGYAALAVDLYRGK